MVIYRSQARSDTPATVIARLIAMARGSAPDHDAVAAWLIEAGELEAGVADEVNDGSEPPAPIETWLRMVMARAGAALVASWDGDRAQAVRHLHVAAATLAHGAGSDRPALPATIRLRAPEGYAHYGVYPEAYLEAARRFVDRMTPRHVTVIGIRSIGTSLSAVVAATAAAHGCGVSSMTVRPYGHPYDRRLAFRSAAARRLLSEPDTHFAIVDEGPGRSGSSFAAVVRALLQIGVPAGRIAVFPSWNASSAHFLNTDAGAIFDRVERYPAEFEPRWLGDTAAVDASAGRWRDIEPHRTAPRPAVWPQMERRKFISGGTLLKFTGLGRYGRDGLARAQTLASAGFSPRVDGFRFGFLRQPWLPYGAVDANRCDAADLDRIASYLAFVATNFAVPRGVPVDETVAMIGVNVQGGLDPASSAAIIAYVEPRAEMFGQRPVAIDGSMLPRDWLRAPGRLLKTDALDHHADHLFPGCQDIAWDVAATCIEFGLDDGRANAFAGAVGRRIGDPSLPSRIPLFSIAYLAFRLGYARSAAEALHGDPDGDAFAAMASSYRRRLRTATLKAA